METQQAPVYSDDQLHERTCIVCDKDDGTLRPDGHVATEERPGRPLVWAVVACTEHLGGRS